VKFTEVVMKSFKQCAYEILVEVGKPLHSKEINLWDYLWFVPAPDFKRLANKLQGGVMLGFVSGRQKKESNKWDRYMIDKRGLANAIIEQMKRI